MEKGPNSMQNLMMQYLYYLSLDSISSSSTGSYSYFLQGVNVEDNYKF